MRAIKDCPVKKNCPGSRDTLSGQVILSRAEEEVSWFPDIPYLRDGTEAHKLDMYCPKIRGPLPVVIYVHGDLLSGRKEDSRHFCRNLCKKG